MANIIEVCYSAGAGEMFFVATKVPEHFTVKCVLEYIHFTTLFPNMGLENIHCGIFSKKVSIDTKLNNYDRIEVYRPLLHSPLQSRINRIRSKTI